MSTITITKPSALLHITGRDLKALFGSVLPHTSDDPDGLPALQEVHVEIHDGDLRLVCTDRFTMAVVRRPMTSTTEAFSCRFALPVRDIRDLIEHLDDVAIASLAFEENRLFVTTEDSAHNIPGSASVLGWRDLLNRVLKPSGTPVGRILIDPTFLARLEPAKRLNEDAPLVIQMQGEHGAVVATLGASFLALVMPMTSRSMREDLLPSRPLDGWFDLLDETDAPA
ncbi:hypothetical protein FHR32_005098 [Streptosporangium album]|uniref:DNA polymerase III beta sliding clamp central domain-containing protein n=1 Tax=Streptosporangium album TaxID=47479 RepID=A0A7W7S0J7_9ACTN|nr:hypothetical protein [Streptosporangium album]MBB4940721.1 hypothetical protein [Streptosporangium album]